MDKDRDLLQFLKQAIDQILTSQRIYIIGHNRLDLDAIASCIGIDYLVKTLKKESFIIVDEEKSNSEAGVKKIFMETTHLPYVTTKEIQNQITKKDTLIILDTNKKELISCQELLPQFKTIMIIDHHLRDVKTMNCPLSYMNSSISSASEIVAKMLEKAQILLPQPIANYLMAGIFLDSDYLTNLDSTNYPQTLETLNYLMLQGATKDQAMAYFITDLESEKKVEELVNKAIVKEKKYVIAISEQTYTADELAKAATRLLKEYQDLSMSFTIGYLDHSHTGISARSNGQENVGVYMQKLGGGGNIKLAAAKVPNTSPYLLKRQLQKILL